MKNFRKIEKIAKPVTWGLGFQVGKYLKIFAVFLTIFAFIVYAWPTDDARAAIVAIITTGTSTWTVPADWNNNANSVEVIGGGGGGTDAASNQAGGGGGGGAYSSSTNLSLLAGGSITVFVGAGGAGGTTANPGQFTLFNVNGSTEGCLDADVCAAPGAAGAPTATALTATSTGGAISSGVGQTKYSGGDGGPGNGGGDNGGGGGGAAGVQGNGWFGGRGNAGTAGTTGAGGGGGAGGGVGNVGKPGTATVGGAGGAGPTGTNGGAGGDGASGSPGSNGSGGGGAQGGSVGGAGGTGQEWATTTSFGSGGGGGGGDNANDGAHGGLYGGGGGAGETGAGNGGQGIIVIQYTPVFVISGTLYNDEGLNADTSGGDIIKLAIATGTIPGLYATTTRTNGFFDFKIPYNTGFTAATGAPMVLWLDGQASKAVAVTKASSTETMSFITGLNLYKNRVIARHEGTTGTSTTIADFQRYDNNNDADIPYIANGGTLTVSAGNGLYIFPGAEFAPAGAVTISGNGPSGVFPDGVLRLASNSTSSIMTLGSNNLTLAGSLFASSTSILTNGGTITFNATTTGKQIIASSTPTRVLGNVTFNGVGGGWTFGDNASTTAFNITNGSVTAPSLLSISGNYTNSGTFTHNSGTVYLNGASAQTIAGTLSGSTGSFSNLTLLNTFDGNPDSNPSVIFSAAASTTGTFTAATASTTIRFLASATSTFQNLTLTGGSATSMVWLRSSTAGTKWGLAVPGTRSVSYVNVQDSSSDCGFAQIDASDGTNVNAGRNNCWNFIAPSITVSGKLYSDEGATAVTTGKTIKLSVIGGAAQSYTSDGAGAFTFSVTQSSLALGKSIAVFVSGDAATRAFALTKASSTSGFITNLDLYQNRIIVKHEQTTGTSTLVNDLGLFPQSLDSAIQYGVSGGALTVNAGQELHIAASSEFAPGGAVTIAGNASTTVYDGSLHLETKNATSSIITMASNNLTLAGSLFASSTSIVSNGGTITFNATTTGKQIIATSSPVSALGNVTFNGSGGGWTFGDNASTTDLITTTGSVTAPTLLTVAGDFLNSATFTYTPGTIYLTGVSKTVRDGGAAFNNVVISGSYTIFEGGNQLLDVNGDATITSGATLYPQQRPLRLSGTNTTLTGGGTLGALLMNGSTTLSGADLTVGTTTIASGKSLQVGAGRVYTSTSTFTLIGTIHGSGTTTVQTRFAPNESAVGVINSNVKFDTTNGNITTDGQRAFGGDVEIFNSGASDRTLNLNLLGTYTFLGNLMFNNTGAGTVTFTSSNLDATANISRNLSFITSGGTIRVGTPTGGNMTVSGNADFTNGTFISDAGHTFTMNGTNKTLTSASQIFNKLTLSGTITTTDAVSATGTLALSGTVNLGSTASTTGDATLSGTIYPQQQPVILNGIGATLTGGGTTGALQTNGTYTLSGNNLTVGTSTIINNGALTVGAGRVYTSTSTLTLVGSITGAGTTTIKHSNLSTGGTLSSNVSFDASGGAITIPARTYGSNVEIVNGSANAVTAGGNATSTGAFLINAGGSFTAPSASNSLYIGRDYTNYGTFTHNSGKVFFNGTGSQGISGATSSSAFNNVDFSGAGAKTFSGNASTTNLTIQNLSGAVTAPTLLSVGGNYSNLGTFIAGTGTTTLSGTSAQTISGVATGTSAFYNLEILNSSASTTFAVAASTTKNFYVVTAGAKVEFAAGATSSITHLIINGQAANTSINLFSGTPGTQWNLYATNTRSVQYSRIQDSDACSEFGDIDATGGTNTNVGNNECWTFAAVAAATATSSADQTFEINQAATAISKLTVTAGSGTGAITAANGLRIAIATSTVNMLFDTTITKALFGGVASSSAKIASCACIGYEGGGSVATTSVITDFSSGDVLTVSGLKFTSFNTAVASSTAIQLFLDGDNDVSANAQDTMRSVAIYGKLALGEHASGQKTNKFDQGGATLTNQEVYSFKFTTTGENSSTTPTISLSEVSGLASANLTNVNLYVDANDNNSVDGGDYTVGGTGLVSITNATGTITFSTPFATSTKNYILRADFTSVNPSDSMTLNLTTSNITASGTVSKINITPSGSASFIIHFRPAGGETTPTGGAAPADVGTFGGTGQSGGAPAGGTTTGGSSGGGTGQGGGAGGGIDLEPLLLRAFANALEGFRSFINFLRSL